MAQVESTLHTKVRQPGNKGVARRLRQSGWIPAVAYGPSREPVHLAIDPKSFILARQEYGASFIYDVQVEDGESFKALIKEVDRDPVSRRLLHIDLFAVDMNKPIKVDVKIILTGKPEGVTAGGMLQQIQREIEVLCLPGSIPAGIEVDVTSMDLGDTLHISGLPFPAGVKPTAVANEAIAIIAAPEAEEEAKPTDEEAAAAAAAEEELGDKEEPKDEAKDKEKKD